MFLMVLVASAFAGVVTTIALAAVTRSIESAAIRRCAALCRREAMRHARDEDDDAERGAEGCYRAIEAMDDEAPRGAEDGR